MGGNGNMQDRITPACAGNRQRGQSVSIFPKDHPRLRGEQRFRLSFCFADQGSPPLARGTVCVVSCCVGDGGITPACAGNRSRWRLGRADAEDHPRLRGEQSWFGDEVTPAQGSPPLARGTERYALYRSWRLGITPACAGNSTRRSGKLL